jgi:hypothetical protein
MTTHWLCAVFALLAVLTLLLQPVTALTADAAAAAAPPQMRVLTGTRDERGACDVDARGHLFVQKPTAEVTARGDGHGDRVFSCDGHRWTQLGANGIVDDDGDEAAAEL